MSTGKKICPLRVMAGFTGDGQECVEEKCAWWVARDGYCSVKTLAYYAGVGKA